MSDETRRSNDSRQASGPVSSEEIDILGAHSDNVAFKRMKAKRRAWGSGSSLNINSLMDIMTILLVFLLLTITSDPLNIQQNEALRMAKMSGGCGFERDPSTNELIPVCRDAYRPPEDSIPITITKRHIMVDNKPVVPVQCQIGGNVCTDDDIHRKFQCETKSEACDPSEVARLAKMRFYIDKSYKEDGEEDKFLIEPLQKELKARVKDHQALLSEMQEQWKGAATIISDANIPFRLISEVIYTSSMSNLHDMRFALLRTSAR